MNWDLNDEKKSSVQTLTGTGKVEEEKDILGAENSKGKSLVRGARLASSRCWERSGVAGAEC